MSYHSNAWLYTTFISYELAIALITANVATCPVADGGSLMVVMNKLAGNIYYFIMELAMYSSQPGPCYNINTAC